MNKFKNNENKKPAVFLDRDGTLIEEVNFLHRVEDLHFFQYTNEAVKLLKENGFLVFVATNQSGIGRKIYSEDEMHQIHEAIQNELSDKIDAFYFCPHLPDEGCRCRKPKTGMIEQSLESFAVDLENSWFVGDKVLDIGTGFNAKLKTALVLTGYGKNDVEKLDTKPDLIVENLLEAVKKIISD